MAYCRFQNTVGNLRDCQDHLFDELDSEEEERARERLIEICKNIAADSEEETMTKYISIMSYEPGLPSHEYVDFCHTMGRLNEDLYVVMTRRSVVRFSEYSEASKEFDRKVKQLKEKGDKS